MEWFLKVVRDNYANFNGRARRKEYWMFTLIYFVISSVLAILGLMFSSFNYISYIVSLALLIPSLAVSVRRLHDINKTGWLMLLCIIPFVNLYLIYLFVLEGDKFSNDYGEDPKAIEHDSTPFTQNNPFERGNNDPIPPHNS